MVNFAKKNRYLSVPSSRIERLLKLGTMAVGITGNMLVSASSDMLIGKKRTIQDLLITNKNMKTLVNQLTELRGAALKIGQLLSLEGGDFLPQPIAEILMEVRNQAYRMPPNQLRNVLADSLGDSFLSRFATFDINPIAAASIGQVHKCKTINNKTLAIKVQYPGIKKSIDSDLKNMAFLLKNSGLLPMSVPLNELIEAAKNQLHQEVDYIAESQNLLKFSKLLKDDLDFDVPDLEPEFSTKNTLAMDFKNGVTIDELISQNQKKKNYVVEKLIALIFREIFEFNLVQTDPNFANFLYDANANKIVLLDFGATKKLHIDTVRKFKNLVNAILNQSNEQIESNLRELGLIGDRFPEPILTDILKIINKSSAPIIENRLYDFGNTTLFTDMENLSKKFLENRNTISVPPTEILLVQRKIAGIFLLARRFKARINLTKLINKYIL